MDSLTQIVLGASVAEACLGRKAGGRAALWGAIGGTIPDLDVVLNLFPSVSFVDSQAWHRGISHSILLFLILSPLLGNLIFKIYKGKYGTKREWIIGMFLVLLTHSILDCFTTWGTQLFWPHPIRVSFHNVFVVDPLYTLPFLLFLLAALFVKKSKPLRRKLNWIGIGISTFYMAMTLINKSNANAAFEKSFSENGIEVSRYESRPTPLNSILWTVNAESEEGYHLGFYSIFDQDLPSKYNYYPKQWHLLDQYRDDPQLQKLLFTTQGYYTVIETNEGLQINDLRFGTLQGWADDPGEFVFRYSLVETPDGLQIDGIDPPRPNPQEMNRYFKLLIDRIKG